MSDVIRAWHFVGNTLRDGRPIPPLGEWLTYDGPLVMCYSGLHASRHPFDALKYAPGATLCLVECADVLEEQLDKLVCRRRRIVERHDVTELLRTLARQQALSVLHLWDAPDAVRRYLTTGDESLRTAASMGADAAAREAARDAAWAATAAARADATARPDATRAAKAAARVHLATKAAAAAARADAASWAATTATWAAAARDAAWADARVEFDRLIQTRFTTKGL